MKEKFITRTIEESRVECLVANIEEKTLDEAVVLLYDVDDSDIDEATKNLLQTPVFNCKVIDRKTVVFKMPVSDFVACAQRVE